MLRVQTMVEDDVRCRVRTGEVSSSGRVIHRAWRGLALVVLLLVLIVGAASAAPNHEVKPLMLSGDIAPVHDPSMIQAGSGYFLFTTGDTIPMRCSTNLTDWSDCGSVFSEIPAWAKKEIPGATNIWAPDISYFNGRYHLYYAVSTFGSNHSVIGLATAQRLEAKGQTQWQDEGPVFASHRSDNWNAIDPNIVIDAQKRPWLAFGSFWSGLYLLKIDAATGKPVAGTPYHLAERPAPPDALEASFIIHRGDYYYLFASYDFCCRGSSSTYNVRVGRSKQVTGPYVDRKGVPMLDGGGSFVAYSYKNWIGPGGESILHDSKGKWWLVYHSYNADMGGVPTLRIAPLRFDRSGWPIPVTPIPKNAS